MDITRNYYSSLPQPIKSYAKDHITKPELNHASEKQKNGLVHLTISNEARQRYDFQIETYSGGLDDAFLEDFFNREAKELKNLKHEYVEIHPLENQFQIEGVQYTFPQGTLEHIVTTALDGKVANPSLYASELSKAIRASVSMPEKSVEERALYRESALAQAHYIAENYFDNEADAQAFLDEVNRFADNDILREKGYIVIDNSDVKPFKEYSSPHLPNNQISFHTFAKRYMDLEYFDRFIAGKGTPKETKAFLYHIQQNYNSYRDDILAGDQARESDAEDSIAFAKEVLHDPSEKNGNLQDIMNTTLQNLGYAEIARWNLNMIKLFL